MLLTVRLGKLRGSFASKAVGPSPPNSMMSEAQDSAPWGVLAPALRKPTNPASGTPGSSQILFQPARLATTCDIAFRTSRACTSVSSFWAPGECDGRRRSSRVIRRRDGAARTPQRHRMRWQLIKSQAQPFMAKMDGMDRRQGTGEAGTWRYAGWMQPPGTSTILLSIALGHSRVACWSALLLARLCLLPGVSSAS